MNNWKKVLCLVLALAMLMLCGCQSDETGNRRKKKRDDAQPKYTESLEYEFRMMDGTWYNENGDVLVSHVYEQVVILDNTEAAERINAAIEEDGRNFVENQSYRLYETDEEMEDYLEIAGLDYRDLFYDSATEVTHNSDGIFSLKMEDSWFMGSVFTLNYFGMTFDMSTGEKLNVLQVMGGDPAEAEEKLNEIICDFLTEKYGESLFDAPDRILEDYDAEEYNFYVEDGQIIVTFMTYLFAPGSEGAAVGPTGIMIGE